MLCIASCTDPGLQRLRLVGGPEGSWLGLLQTVAAIRVSQPGSRETSLVLRSFNVFVRVPG